MRGRDRIKLINRVKDSILSGDKELVRINMSKLKRIRLREQFYIMGQALDKAFLEMKGKQNE
jgi:hypothetical protein